MSSEDQDVRLECLRLAVTTISTSSFADAGTAAGAVVAAAEQFRGFVAADASDVKPEYPEQKAVVTAT